MTSTKRALLGAGGLAVSLLTASVMAQPDFSRLGQDLTPIGAERSGNASGIIPEWTGGLGPDAGRQLADGFAENPFAAEQPRFVITAQNYRDYADNLTPGQIALFERYPETFRMPVYESHRSVGFKQEIYDKVRNMAGTAQLVNNGDGITNFPHGTFAFPIPQTGAEVVWNHLTRHRLNVHRRYMQAMPQVNGSFNLIRFEEEVGYPAQMGDVDHSAMPNNLLFFKQRVNAPARLAGSAGTRHPGSVAGAADGLGIQRWPAAGETCPAGRL